GKTSGAPKTSGPKPGSRWKRRWPSNGAWTWPSWATSTGDRGVIVPAVVGPAMAATSPAPSSREIQGRIARSLPGTFLVANAPEARPAGNGWQQWAPACFTSEYDGIPVARIQARFVRARAFAAPSEASDPLDRPLPAAL